MMLLSQCMQGFLLSKTSIKVHSQVMVIAKLQHPMYHRMTAAGPNKVSCKTYKAHRGLYGHVDR